MTHHITQVIATNYALSDETNTASVTQAQGRLSAHFTGDTTPPSIPTLSAASNSVAVTLTWNPSTDNVAVSGYKLYRNSSIYTTFSSLVTSYADTNITQGSSYIYTIQSFDTSHNSSSQSNAVSVTVPQVTPPFSIGDTVYTTSKVNIRSTPTLKGKPLGTQKVSATGIILDGPQTGGGYTWWFVDFTSGTDGWVVGDYLGK